MKALTRWFPWLIVLLAAAYVASQAVPRSSTGPMDLQAFGKTPVMFGGRVMPLDSVARVSLLTINGKQTLETEAGEEIPAIRWLADVIGSRPEAERYRVFRIDHPDALTLIDQEQDGRKRFSYDELSPHVEAIFAQAERAQQIDSEHRNAYQQAVLELAVRVMKYQELRGFHQPLMVPPTGEGTDWQAMRDAFAASMNGTPMSGPAESVRTLISSYHQEDAREFNTTLAGYHRWLADAVPGAVSRAGFETFFNTLQPFYVSSVLYVGAGLLVVFSWLGWAGPLRRSAVGLMLVALVVHTFGLGARTYLLGRPPVTNLYASAVFIGWGCVILGLLAERVNRQGLGLITGSAIGFVTLLIAHHLASGDTMEPVQAVLATNFWLAVHVITITIGYSATFFAGLLGIIYIIRGVCTNTLDTAARRNLSTMIYGVICFALLLSFFGTVSGGIWADQSWGRFWGWDPKENGAALIVLMNALILHARWGGMIKDRGIAVLAVGGNIVTSWSWFGTNMLGVGLHSYGFMDSAMFWLLAFVFSQLAIMAVGMLPLRLWRSAAATTPAPRLGSDAAAGQAGASPA